MRVPIAVALASWLVVTAAPSLARAEPGTHVLLEVHGGVAGSSAEILDAGFSFGGTVGFGGKLRGFPPRFYAVASYRSSFFTGEGVHPATGAPFDVWQADHELTAGLRVVLPLWSRIFRVYGEMRAGTQGHTATLDRQRAATLHESSWDPVLALACGLQARWHPNASLGLTLEWAVADRDRDLVSVAAGASAAGNARTALYLSNTWHF